MKVKLIFLFVIIVFAKSFSQNPCPTIGGCDYGNNYQTTAVFYVHTDSVLNITDTSAVLKGGASTLDSRCNFGSASIKVTAIAAWSTNCNPVCNSNLSALDTASIGFENFTCPTWYGGGSTKIKLKNLLPNTTYYVRYIVGSQFYSQAQVPPWLWSQQWLPIQNLPVLPYGIGNILTFKTKKSSFPRIKNNIITSGDQKLTCPQNTGIYSPSKLIATLPIGGNGNYTYLWQRSVDGGKTWHHGETTSGNTSQNYQPSQYSQAQSPLLYRRLVFSGKQIDTSKYVTLTFVAGPISMQTIAVNPNPGNNTANVTIALTINQKATNIYSSGICWSTSPIPTFNWNNPVAGTYTNTPLTPGTYLMTGLLSNTTYYVRAYAYAGSSHDYKYCYGAILSFTNGISEIGNNSITSNQATCQIRQYSYAPTQFNGALPIGGNGTYSYLWEKSSDGGQTWNQGQTDIGSANGQNYIPSQFSEMSIPTPCIYRRIVTSGSQTNTSNTVLLTFLPPGFNPNPVITQLPTNTNDVLLTASITPYIKSNYSIQWQDSVTGKAFANITALPSGNLLLPVTTNTSNNYRAIINYGSNCPSVTSKVIGISPKDGDGNIYPTVQINTQTWMINNLRTTKFIDGTPITKSLSTVSWASASSPAFCWYNNDSVANAVTYGSLYNNFAITQVNKNVCPVGWRIATATDWSTLSTLTGGSTGASAGQVLKSTGVWVTPNYTSNIYNFNATPGGEITKEGVFNSKLSAGTWWAPGNNLTHYKLVNFSDNIFYVNTTDAPNAKNAGFSVRCVQYNN